MANEEEGELEQRRGERSWEAYRDKNLCCEIAGRTIIQVVLAGTLRKDFTTFPPPPKATEEGKN